MKKASPPRPAPKRPKSAGSSGGDRGSRYLRAAVLVAMVISVVVLLSVAFSGGTNREGKPSPAGPGQSDAPGSPAGSGPAALLLDLAQEVPGIVITEIGAQSITDMATGAKDPVAERERLASIGFREAAIVVGIKSPEAGGLIAGSDLVIQIVHFGDASGARTQSERDGTGALAADFGAASPGAIEDSALADGGFTFDARGPATPRGESSIKGVAIRQGAWTISVVATSPSGVKPAPDELLSDLAVRQAAKLRGD
ncbi:MAG: hypothetical protein DCC49_01720 [Acidobacteria bacterium]|nr:MAG: hypothetical protein DCC49_01720 [Acidobacteriota bacterium]